MSISPLLPVDTKKYIPTGYSAMNIDSVKINTSLIMMKECLFQGLDGQYIYFNDPGVKRGSTLALGSKDVRRLFNYHDIFSL